MSYRYYNRYPSRARRQRRRRLLWGLVTLALLLAGGYYGLRNVAPVRSFLAQESSAPTPAATSAAATATVLATPTPAGVAATPVATSPREVAASRATATATAGPAATPAIGTRWQSRRGATATATPKAAGTPRATAAQGPRRAQVERRYYTVSSGDYLYSIAERFDVSTQALASANGLGMNAEVYVGQRLLVPTRKVDFGLELPAVRKRLDRLATRPLSELSPELVRYLESRAGTTSAAVYLPENDTMYVHNPDERYLAASTAKVPIMLTQLSRQERRVPKLSEIDPDLLVRTIVVGENEAATQLFRSVGGRRAVEAELRARGLTDTRIAPDQWGLSTTTAPDMALLVRSLYYGERLNADLRRVGLGLMSSVVELQRWGVPAGLPRSASVAFKGGWLPTGGGWQVHQVGVAEIGGQPYVFAFYTDGQPTEVYGRETLEGAAEILAREAR